MKIAILDDYQCVIRNLECYTLLQQHDVVILEKYFQTVDELVEVLTDIEVLVLTRERTAITKELLAQLPNLKLISQTGKVSNHLDLDACTKYNVAVAEGVGSPIAPAELAWILIMNAYRQIPQAIEGMKNGQWQTNIGKSLYGETIGIWGYGKIGRRIASYARAFGMKILVWGSENSRAEAEKDGFLAATDKEHFFSVADIVSLHLRLTDTTKGIVALNDLKLMKPEALFVNTSRAELLENNALLSALKSGRPGFAALDVFDKEPVFDKDSPFLKMYNVVCTPHLGYVEKKGYELYFSKAFENILAFASGKPVNIANPQVLPPNL